MVAVRDFVKKTFWLRNRFDFSTYQIGYASLNVLFNLTMMNIFKTHVDVYVLMRRENALVYSQEIDRRRFQMHTYGEIYTECKYI